MGCTRLYLLVSIGFLFLNIGYSQSYNPSLNITTTTSKIKSTGFVEYTTTNAASGDARFTLFGDGFFGMENSFNHQFPADSTGFTTKTFFNRRYKRQFPTKRDKVTGETGSSGNSNKKIKMTGSSRVGTSWSPCKTIENYFILIFENTSSVVDSGCVEFYYNDKQLDLNNNGIIEYNGWVSNKTLSSVTGSSLYNRKIKWDVDNFNPGEQRVVYIPMTALVGSGTRLKVGSKYSSGCTGGSGGSGVTGAYLTASGYPHDPNLKVANKKCGYVAIQEQQTLQYTIRFQNEGDAPAINVYLTDYLDDIILDLGTLKFLDSEYPFTYQLIGNKLEITFSNIQLPGLKQSTPETYTYDDTESFIQFEICTHLFLPQTVLLNEAEIVFDYQPVILTNISEVPFLDNCTEMVDVCDPGMKVTNTKELTAESIEIFPNPTMDIFSIEGIGNELVNINVYNQQGQLVIDNYGNSEGNKTINLFGLPKGVYFVHIRNEQLNITKRVIKM